MAGAPDRDKLRADAHRALRNGKLTEAFSAFAGILGPAPDSFEKKILFTHAFETEKRAEHIALMFAAALLADDDADSATMLYQIACKQNAAGCEFFVATPHGDMPAYCADHAFPAVLKPRYDLVKMSMRSQEQSTARSFVCGLPGGRVTGESYIPLAADGTIFIDQVYYNPIRAFRYDAGISLDCVAVPAQDRYLLRASQFANYGPAILIGETPNAGHWILNHVMPLVMALSEPRLSSLPVIVGPNTTRSNF